MFVRFNKEIADRRAGIKREEGFTLIELLVVVIIIGILAAIAIPIYVGVQSSSKDSAVKSDLANAKIAVIAYVTDKPSTVALPTLDTTTLGAYGFTKSEFTTSFTKGTTQVWPAFCISAPKASDSTKSFSVTSSGGVVDAPC